MFSTKLLYPYMLALNTSAVTPSTSAVALYDCEQANASKTCAMQKLDMSHDLGEDGPSSTEARIWLATLAVAACAVPEVTDATNASLDSGSIPQSVDVSTQYQLPTISASQSAVANEIILRILISKGMNIVGADSFRKLLSVCAT